MSFKRADLAAVIGEKTLHVSDLRRLAKEVAAFLLTQKRVSELESLMRDVLAYREAKGVIEAEVASAHELTGVVQQEVKQLMKQHYPNARKVIVHNHLEPELVGGLKINVAAEQLDLSLKGKLDEFKRLTEGIN